MPFHEHTALKAKNYKEGVLLVCQVCNKKWKEGFAIISHADGKGNLIDKQLIDTNNNNTIECDLLKTKKLQKTSDFELSHVRESWQ